MLGALRGLTTRGRSFLAAGGAAALSALILGERDLLRIAALLAALPILAAIAVSRTKYRLSCSRTVTPDRVQAGSPAQVTLRLENLSRVPTGVMLLEDRLPFTLGSRPRFVLDRLFGRQTSTVAYPVRADARGKYELGPLTVRLTDPFGLCELTRAFSSVGTLVAAPVVVPLPAVRIAGGQAGSGESRTRSAAVHGEDDAATREYRHGDDLRKVHWRSTARIGELMVRREEQPWHSTATVLLDTRLSAHRGDGPASSFEWAVSAAASIAVHMGRTGYALRLLTDGGIDVTANGTDGAGALLDVLAEVHGSKNNSLQGTTDQVRRYGEGLVIAVLGAMDAEDAARLAAARGADRVGVVVLVNTATWSVAQRSDAKERYDEIARQFRLAGWRVLTVRQGTRLDALWPHAASRSGMAGPTAPVSPGPGSTERAAV